MSGNADISVLMPYLERQQTQMNNMEKQLEKLTDVVMRIALLEERRTQDRKQVEEIKEDLEAARREAKEAIEKVQKKVEELEKVKPQYDDMLESYKKFKNAVIVFLCSGLLAAAVAFGSGIVKLAPH